MLTADSVNGRVKWNTVLVEKNEYISKPKKKESKTEDEEVKVEKADKNNVAQLDNLVSMMEAKENLPQIAGSGKDPTKVNPMAKAKKRYIGGYIPKPKRKTAIGRTAIDGIMEKYGAKPLNPIARKRTSNK